MNYLNLLNTKLEQLYQNINKLNTNKISNVSITFYIITFIDFIYFSGIAKTFMRVYLNKFK
jgi:hypothetical protein